jgi:hypothetical protein
MRQAWFLALCRHHLLGVILAGALAFTGLGCHQHYYYYGDSPCGPSTTTVPSTVQSGTTIRDEPTQVVEGGTKVSTGATVSSNVSSSTKSPRVVLSEPRNSWKTADPDSSAPTTTAEGYINSTVKQ